MSTRTYCDVCKKEIKFWGSEFNGLQDGIRVKVEAYQDSSASKDICLPCVIKAINKESTKLLKRKYHINSPCNQGVIRYPQKQKTEGLNGKDEG